MSNGATFGEVEELKWFLLLVLMMLPLPLPLAWSGLGLSRTFARWLTGLDGWQWGCGTVWCEFACQKAGAG